MATLDLANSPAEHGSVPVGEMEEVVDDVLGPVGGVKAQGQRPRRQPPGERRPWLVVVRHRIVVRQVLGWMSPYVRDPQ